MDAATYEHLHRDYGINIMPLRKDSKVPAGPWREKFKNWVDEPVPDGYNAGLVLGHSSDGLYAIDFDTPDIHDKVLPEFTGKTLHVRSGGGGDHYIFRTTGRLPRQIIGMRNAQDWVLDIKSEGGFIVAPGSTHDKTGNKYEIISDLPPLVIKAEDVITMITSRGFTMPRTSQAAGGKSAREGSRNHSLFIYCREHVEEGMTEEAALYARAKEINASYDPPMDDYEVRGIVASAIKRTKPKPVRINDVAAAMAHIRDVIGAGGDNINFMRLSNDIRILGIDAVISEIQKIRPGYRLEIGSKQMFADIRPDIYAEEPCSFDAMIIAEFDRTTYVKTATYACPECGADLGRRDCDRMYDIHPPKCDQCSKPGIIKSSTSGYSKKITMQELINGSIDAKSDRMNAEVFDDDAAARVGDNKEIVARMRSIPGKKNRNEILPEVLWMRDLGEARIEMPTPEEEAEWAKMDISEVMKNDLAPHVIGMDMEKELIMCSLVGGMSIAGSRDLIHIGFLGPTGGGKSSLIRAACELTPGAAYADAALSSGVGLTTAYITLADGRRIPSMGLLAKHSGSFVGMDEGNIVNNELKELRNCLENGYMVSNKAGFSDVKFRAETTMAITGNPKGREYNNSLSLKENSGLDYAILSRLDMIMYVPKATGFIVAEAAEAPPRKMPTGAFGRYVNRAKSIKVKMPSKRIIAMLKDRYTRWLDIAEQARLEVDTRHQYAVFRLAASFAKRRLSDTITEADVQKLSAMIEHQLKSFSISGVDLTGSSDPVAKAFKEIFQEHADSDGTAAISEVTADLNGRYQGTFRAMGILDDLAKAGKIRLEGARVRMVGEWN